MSEYAHERIRPVLHACAMAAVMSLLLPGAAHSDREFRDPTRPPLARIDPTLERKIETRAPLKLSAVFLAEGHRTAIVNGERVGKGDVIQGARVIAIERGRVVLIRGDTRIELALVEDVKRPSPPHDEPGPHEARTGKPMRVPAAPREGSPS